MGAIFLNNNEYGGGGSGLPSGGTTGQVLSKRSGADRDVEWINPPTVDLTNYYTKTQVDDRINAAITSALSTSY